MALKTESRTCGRGKGSLSVASDHGFTLMEMIVVLAILFVLANLFMPVSHARPKAQRIKCVNNLKNVGLGFRIFATDNDDRFPWQVPATNGGTKEWVSDGTQIWRHWNAVSNELSTPRMLVCPSDDRGEADPKWGTTNTTSISYFIGLNGTGTNAATILGGDRNVTIDGKATLPGRLVLGTNGVVGFSGKMHRDAGNILLADGSVQQVTSARMHEAVRNDFEAAGVLTNTWLMP